MTSTQGHRAAIVSPNIRVRANLTVGDGSIVDDFCYFSANVVIGRGSHISAGCSIAGGSQFTCRIGDLCSLSAGVRVWCSSNDFVNDLIAIGEFDDMTPHEGDVDIGNYCGIGANSVVMPGNALPEGTAIGALSFVPPRFAFSAWTVYAGIPIRPIRPRNRERVLRQVERLALR